MLPLLPIVGLVGTNNLSTAIIILGIGVILAFISHPRYLPFIGIGAVGMIFIAVFSGWRVIVWSVLRSGEIRRLMKKDFKPFRDSMQSEVEGFLEVDLGAVFRNLDLFQKRKTT